MLSITSESFQTPPMRLCWIKSEHAKELCSWALFGKQVAWQYALRIEHPMSTYWKELISCHTSLQYYCSCRCDINTSDILLILSTMMWIYGGSKETTLRVSFHLPSKQCKPTLFWTPVCRKEVRSYLHITTILCCESSELEASVTHIKCNVLLVSTYVVCERLSVMHKQVCVQ